MRRVVKIGGSLLGCGDLESRFGNWIANQPSAENLVIVGGGEYVDAVRRADLRQPSDAIEVHWRCVELLDQSRRVVSAWPDWNSVETADQFRRSQRIGFPTDRPTLVAVKAFYDRRSTVDVPLNWDTTSDTIAAILADRVQADELVLLKSCEIEPTASLRALSRAGIVDAAFSKIAGNLAAVRVERLT